MARSSGVENSPPEIYSNRRETMFLQKGRNRGDVGRQCRQSEQGVVSEWNCPEYWERQLIALYSEVSVRDVPMLETVATMMRHTFRTVNVLCRNAFRIYEQGSSGYRIYYLRLSVIETGGAPFGDTI